MVDDDGIAHRRSISLGARSVSEVQVVGGLEVGERVVKFDNVSITTYTITVRNKVDADAAA